MTEVPNLAAVVVSCNEGHLLKRCLSALTFCDEVVVVDLESVDDTAAVAAAAGARVVRHTRVNHVEVIHAKLEEFTHAPWVLLLDPDEVVPPALQREFKAVLDGIAGGDIGLVRAPWKFFFADRPLAGTVWGGDTRWKDFIIQRSAVEMTGLVHQGRRLRPGYRATKIELNAEKSNAVQHYWMSSYQQLVEKHRRYLAVEGQAMHAQGLRFSRLVQLRGSIAAFKECYVSKEGYKDGWSGLFLSIFWSWYTWGRWDSLRSFEARRP